MLIHDRVYVLEVRMTSNNSKINNSIGRLPQNGNRIKMVTVKPKTVTLC